LEERRILLNRTKIALNISRQPWEDSSLRYFVVAPNRAMIVTEPTLPHTPFTPGVHLVEAPIEQIGRYDLLLSDSRGRTTANRGAILSTGHKQLDHGKFGEPNP
jgi:hypothetical protein